MISTGKPGLRVGAAEAIITPPVGLRLVGPLRRSTGVHDELYARSIVLSDGTTDAALVFLDLIGIDKPFSDAIRREISARTGIAHVLINCSHTHSAPFTIPWSVEGHEEYEEEAAPWRDELIATVAATVKDAAARRRDATAASGKARVQVGINRRFATADGIDMRPNPEGPVVSSVDVLCFDLDGGERKIILASHAAHPVIVHGASTLIER